MDGTTDAPEYQEGLVHFYRKHILNLEVCPPGALKVDDADWGRRPDGLATL